MTTIRLAGRLTESRRDDRDAAATGEAGEADGAVNCHCDESERGRRWRDGRKERKMVEANGTSSDRGAESMFLSRRAEEWTRTGSPR
jgi:hypothetical protein